MVVSNDMCAKVCSKAQSAVETRLLVILIKCFKVAEVIHTGVGGSKLGPPTQSQEKQRMGETFITSSCLQSILRGSPPMNQ